MIQGWACKPPPQWYGPLGQGFVNLVKRTMFPAHTLLLLLQPQQSMCWKPCKKNNVSSTYFAVAAAGAACVLGRSLRALRVTNVEHSGHAACICMHISRTRPYAYICMHMHAHAYAYACICMHMHAYACICMHTNAYACICMHMNAHAHSQTPTRSHGGGEAYNPISYI